MLDSAPGINYTAQAMNGTSEAEAALRALEARLDAARVGADVALFEQVLASEFRTTNPAGAVTGRQQALDDARSGALRVKSSQSVDISVELTDGVAIVRGKAIMKAAYTGHDISGTYAYTHVYVHRDGRWQVVAAHTSRRMPDWAFLVLTRFLNLFGVKRAQ